MLFEVTAQVLNLEDIFSLVLLQSIDTSSLWLEYQGKTLVDVVT